MSTTVIVILMFLLGLLLIIKGGDFFVDAASWIAEVSGIPKFLIGATIVSMATTLPELLVSLMASANGSNGIAVGNAVGSVTANVGLIMGISVVCLPSIINRKEHAFKFIMMAAAIALLYVFSVGGSLSIAGSVILLFLFLAFMAENVISARTHMRAETDTPKAALDKRSTIINLVKFIVGVAGIIVGADLMVDHGTSLARIFGVPESIIGATLVAVGTSLPELITTISALSKKQASLSIGNIIGANIMDLTLILPLCSVISGKALPMLRQNIILDMPVCLGLCLFAVLPPLLTGKFYKWQGICMLAIYATYIVMLSTGIIA